MVGVQLVYTDVQDEVKLIDVLPYLTLSFVKQASGTSLFTRRLS
jgi:hypothetical protein